MHNALLLVRMFAVLRRLTLLLLSHLLLTLLGEAPSLLLCLLLGTLLLPVLLLLLCLLLGTLLVGLSLGSVPRRCRGGLLCRPVLAARSCPAFCPSAPASAFQ
jgi:hypothetical protein